MAKTVVSLRADASGVSAQYLSLRFARNYVAKALGANYSRPQFQADAAEAISAAIADFNIRNEWNYRVIRSSSVVLQAGIKDYPLPPDFIKPYSVRVIGDGADRPLYPMDQRPLDRLWGEEQSAGPFFYSDTLFGIGQIELYPIPTATGAILDMRYYAAIPDPQSDHELFVMPRHWVFAMLDIARARALLGGYDAENTRARTLLALGQGGLQKAIAQDRTNPDKPPELKPRDPEASVDALGSVFDRYGVDD